MQAGLPSLNSGALHWPLAEPSSLPRHARAEPGAAEMRQTIASMLAGEDPVGPEVQSQGMELASEALQAPRPACEGGEGPCRPTPAPHPSIHGGWRCSC